VMEDAVAEDEVERRRVERQRFRVVVNECPAEPAQAKILFCEPQMPGREIHVGDARAARGELREIGPDSTADLEDVLSCMPRELHHLRHPRGVHPITMALDLEKPIERVRLRFTRVLGAYRILVPLFLNTILVRISRLDAARAGDKLL